MSNGIGFLGEDLIRHEAQSLISRIFWGVVREVNPEEQTMTVEVLLGTTNRNTYTIPISNMFIAQGAGLRVMPIKNVTRVIVYRDFDGQFYHLGYVLENIEQFTADLSGEKERQTTLLLHRYLDEGEVQLIGITNNEILLANDGSILVKAQNGSFLRLENYTASLEGVFQSVSLMADKTQIRAGKVRRSVSPIGTDETLYVVNDEVKKESEIDINNTNRSSINEFMVKVGVSLDNSDSTPAVGTLFLGNRFVDDAGNEVAISGNSVQFKVELANGGGIGIDEYGSFYIIDRRGGDGTVFESGLFNDGAKAFRVGRNVISITNESGIEITAESGASIVVSKNGEVVIRNKDGRSIELNQNGSFLSFPGATVTIQAKDLQLVANTVSFGMMPTDNLLAARLFAAIYDVHTHAGPCGPVVIPLTPLVNAGVVTVAGVNVSV